MTDAVKSEVIALAWCDKTSFDDIYHQFGIPEKDVKALMRSELKGSSYRLWRRRVTGRKAKHRNRLVNKRRA